MSSIMDQLFCEPTSVRHMITHDVQAVNVKNVLESLQFCHQIAYSSQIKMFIKLIKNNKLIKYGFVKLFILYLLLSGESWK